MDNNYSAQKIIDLINSAKNGDQTAFTEIYQSFYAPLYRYIYSKTRDSGNTEDILQEVFLKIYKSIMAGSLHNGHVSPLAYFYTVARNLIIDESRKKRTLFFKDCHQIENIKDNNLGINEALAQKQGSELVLAVINKLEEGQQEVIQLRYSSEMSYREISQIIGKSEEAVRQ
ncbi:hypothetical protein COT98_04210, partial [Candidatus Falkowbacteria bacterium CG10_big_fil_rev_8_21_14_0_10_39_9]